MSQQFKLKNLIPPAFNRKNGKMVKKRKATTPKMKRKKTDSMNMKNKKNCKNKTKIYLPKIFTPVIPPQHYLRFPIYSFGSDIFFFLNSFFQHLFIFVPHRIYTHSSCATLSFTIIATHILAQYIYNKSHTPHLSTNSHLLYAIK